MSESRHDTPDPARAIAHATLAQVCSELIALRERNDRQHRLYEQAQQQFRDDWQARFQQFVAETQQAYQRLRDELTGEKRWGLAVLSACAEIVQDFARLQRSLPPAEGEAHSAWEEGLGIAVRKAEAWIASFGVHRYDAVIGSEYQPTWHERVGTRPMAGLDSLRVAEQIEPGLASGHPEFVLRRAKVLVSE